MMSPLHYLPVQPYLAQLLPTLAQEVSNVDLTLILVYMGITAFLGYLGYRHTRSAADYLLAGRKVHPFIMAMSYGATFISTSAIVGFGGVAGMFGMSLLWLTFFNIFVGIFIAFVFLGGPTRRIGHRLNAHTFPELLGRRYESPLIQILAGLVIFLVMPLYAGAVLIGGTEFITTAFHMDYTLALLLFAVITAVYVFYGGLKGVLYTDTFQGTIMTLGMLALIIGAYWTLGGVKQTHTDLTAMKDQAFAGFKAVGHQGWTEMPRFGFGQGDAPAGKPSPFNLWWIVISTITLGVGIGVLAQPQLVVRFLTVKSGRELNRALVYGGVFILLMTGVAFTVGSLSNVYFFKHEIITGKLVSREDTTVVVKREPGQKPVAIPCRLMHLDTTRSGKANVHLIEYGIDVLGDDGKVKLPGSKLLPQAQVTELEEGWVKVKPQATAFTRAVVFDEKNQAWMCNPDSIIPIYVTQAMPRWFRVVFLLTLLAAAMSTMSSQYHTLGSAIGHDVFGRLLGNRDGSASNRSIMVVRIGIIIGLILAVTLGYYARGGYIIARATAIFFGLCAAMFLPAFVGGLFWQRATKAGALASMLTGFVVSGFWLMFIKEAEAGALGVVRIFTGGPNSLLHAYPNWPVVDPIIVALPISLLVFVVVSCLSNKPSEAHLQKCFGKNG